MRIINTNPNNDITVCKTIMLHCKKVVNFKVYTEINHYSSKIKLHSDNENYVLKVRFRNKLVML